MTKPILAALMFFGLPAPSYSSEVSQNVPGFTKVLLMSDFHFDPEKPRGRTADFSNPKIFFMMLNLPVYLSF